MLPVPRLRQPDSVSCLPACVWSVLRFQGYEVEYPDVARACRLGQLGAVPELAIQGLMEAGWDVEVLREFDVETVEEALAAERPLIVMLTVGSIGIESFGHAVVLRGITEEAVSVMNPMIGEYETIPRHEFADLVARDFSGAFFIAGRP